MDWLLPRYPGTVSSALVAQVATGATLGGAAAVLTHPAMAPLLGALAALAIALIQAAIRRLNGKKLGSDADQEALQAAAAQAARAAVEAVLAARHSPAPAAPATPPPRPPAAPLAVLVALALGGAALLTLPGCSALGLGTPSGRPVPLAVKDSPELGRCASSGYEVDVPPHATVATIASVCVRPYSPPAPQQPAPSGDAGGPPAGDSAAAGGSE